MGNSMWLVLKILLLILINIESFFKFKTLTEYIILINIIQKNMIVYLIYSLTIFKEIME